jgi:large subunit ribosomal protein L30
MMMAVIRVRGIVNVDGKISDTLKMLRLNQANHCVIIPLTPTYKGMLQVVKDYVTWGEVDQKAMAELLKRRGQLMGGANVTDSAVKSNTGFDGISAYSQAVVSEETKMKEFKSLKPVFRLSPPKKGFEGVKRAFTVGGALGYRGDKINQLIRRML